MTTSPERLHATGNSVRELNINTKSGRGIHTTIFEVSDPISVVIIAGAMGVVQKNYAKFALFLNEHGHTVITFDYYGTGLSLCTPMKACDADVRSWGEQDCEAIIDYALAHFPKRPVQWIGHSVGGQLLGIIRNAGKLSNAITLSCGTGYWRYNSPETRRYVWFMWYIIAPLLVKIFGYFPGRKLKIVGDLPPNVMWQWRRWCLVEDYAVGVEGPEIRRRYADLNIPITSISFKDDEMLSEKNINGLNRFFNQNNLTRIRVDASAIGETFIGHLGWIKEKFRQSIWHREILPRLMA